MSTGRQEFQTGVVNGMECLQEGWALIQDKYWLFFGITFVSMLVGGAIPLVLQGAMICGVFLCLFARMRGEEVPFDMLFKGFDYLLDSLLALLIMIVIGMVVAIIPLGLFVVLMVAIGAGGGGNEAVWIVIVLLAIVSFLVYMLVILALNAAFLFVFPLIVDRGLKPMDAVSLSFAAAKANLGGLIVFMLLCMAGMFAGALMCGIGMYFFLPIVYAAQAVVYRRIFPDLQTTEKQPPLQPA